MAEQSAFLAKIKQLLHPLIHSLYTDCEIFWRELIPNADVQMLADEGHILSPEAWQLINDILMAW